jgi:RNA-directed DNA polymerase
MRISSERSSWWLFTRDFKRYRELWIRKFIAGKHIFEPLLECKFSDETVRIWSYRDRLIIYLILQIIKPVFKHIISPLCRHLAGPSAVKVITQEIKAALNSGRYKYYLRLDIKSYYASINHKILISQIEKHFDDPIMLKYLRDIVTIPVNINGAIILPTVGIPVRSALSPFFGALYLSELDHAFENRKNTFYFF